MFQESNTFQAALVSDGVSSFVIFNYDRIEFTETPDRVGQHAQVRLAVVFPN